MPSIDVPGSLNAYTYVENSPTNRNDPLGLAPEIISYGGNDYAVFYRGQNQTGIAVPLSPERGFTATTRPCDICPVESIRRRESTSPDESKRSDSMAC